LLSFAWVPFFEVSAAKPGPWIQQERTQQLREMDFQQAEVAQLRAGSGQGMIALEKEEWQ
jgi:hypothetical protein